MAERAEAEKLLGMCTYPALRGKIQAHVDILKASEAAVVAQELRQEGMPPTPPTAASTSAASKPAPASNTTAAVVYTTPNDFYWDQGDYNSPTVTVTVEIPGVGALKSIEGGVTCKFTEDSFDLKVTALGGKNYRLFKDNLDKDIIPSKSKFIVKNEKVLIKMAKVKGEYSYENWTSLCCKKSKADKQEKKAKAGDPMGGIMDMMKDMYDSGDDNMKKIIGEAMMKSQRGDTSTPEMPSMPDSGTGMPDLSI